MTDRASWYQWLQKQIGSSPVHHLGSFFSWFRGAVMQLTGILAAATKAIALQHLTGLLHCSERWQAGPLA